MNAPFAVRPLLRAKGFDDLMIAPSLERRRLQCYLALMLGDIASLVLGFGIVGYIYLGPHTWLDALVHGQLLLPVFLTIALYNGAYSREALQNVGRGIYKAGTALLVSGAVVVFIAFYEMSEQLSRLTFTGGAICSGIILIFTRLQMRRFVAWRCGANVMNELVIDDGGPTIDLPGTIRICAKGLQLSPNLNDPHALDRIGLVLRNIDRVIVSCPAERRAAWAMMLKGANIEGEVLDDVLVKFGAQGARVAGNHGLLLVSVGPLGLRARAIKRIFDLAFASTALIVLSPLLLAVALAIRLEDGGPVFFIQRRMGRGNRFFDMYKFRSMSTALCDKDAKVLTKKHDARVTRLGRVIRATSIDELPQLINVLRGDMSLVGPRPHAIGALAGNKLYWEVDLRYWQRHCLKPGLSGLAQIRGFRGATEREVDLVDRLQADLEYLEGWTIVRDIKILFLTLGVLVHHKAF